MDTTLPAVYVSFSSTEFAGHAYQQALYVWWYPAEGERLPGQPRAMGLLVVADEEGFPVLWMPLGSSPDARVVYVSRSTELAAAQQYGVPLPGRRYAVERAVAKRPRTYVARVLEDGPVPMGPYVLIDRARRAINSVYCRCMPSQADEFVTEQWYDLRPLAELVHWGIDAETLGLDELWLHVRPNDNLKAALTLEADLAAAIRWPK